MGRDVLYLYAFVRHGEAEVRALEGVEEGRGVGVVDCGDLDAIVSLVPLEAYEPARGDEGPADPGWVIPRALRHERVVEAINARSAALPARFGTVFSSAEAIARLAARHRDPIVAFLGEVDGKDEWSLKGDFEAEGAVERMLATDPVLAGRYRALPATPGARFFKEKALREEARVQARRAALAAAKRAHDLLTATASCRALPLRRPDAPGREMVMNLACLLPRGDAAAAIESVRMVTAEDTGPPLLLTVNGPWPPFNFCPELTTPHD